MLTAAISFLLTAGGVAVAGLRARRRRFRSATRWFAVALLPAGLYLTGLFPLAATIGRAFGDWAAKLVFDPRVWTGLVLLGVSAALLLATRWTDRRGAVEASPERPAAAGAAPERPAVTQAAKAPKASTASGKQQAGKRDDGLGDFADVEEILRKRGI